MKVETKPLDGVTESNNMMVLTFDSTRSLHGVEMSMAPAVACFRNSVGTMRYGTGHGGNWQ